VKIKKFHKGQLVYVNLANDIFYLAYYDAPVPEVVHIGYGELRRKHVVFIDDDVGLVEVFDDAIYSKAQSRMTKLNTNLKYSNKIFINRLLVERKKGA
jgi:hypothetical protein